MIYLLIYLAIGVFVVLFLRKLYDDALDEIFADDEIYRIAKPFMWLIFVLIWPYFIIQIIIEKP